MKIPQEMKMMKVAVIMATAMANVFQDAYSAFIWWPVVQIVAKILWRSIMMETHFPSQVSYHVI